MRKIITVLACWVCVFLAFPAWAAQPDTSAADILDFPVPVFPVAGTPILPSATPYTMDAVDPDWYDSATLGALARDPRMQVSQGWGGYGPTLWQALQGNAQAMVDIYYTYYYWSDKISAAFPHFPAAMHDEDYWQNLASRFVSPGWFHARLAEKVDGSDSKAWAYAGGIEVDSPECLYEDAQITPHHQEVPGMLAKSVTLGWGKAATLLARAYYRYPDRPRRPSDNEQQTRYLWLGAGGGDSEAFFTLAFDAFAGTYGVPKNTQAGYLYAAIGARLRATHDGFLLAGRAEPPHEPLPVKTACEQAIGYSVRTYYSGDRPLLARETIRNSCTLGQDAMDEANAMADAWIAEYKAKQDAALSAARERRAVLVKEMQTELTPVMEAFARQREADAAEKAAQEKTRTQETVWVLPSLSQVVTVLFFIVLIFLIFRKPTGKKAAEKSAGKGAGHE